MSKLYRHNKQEDKAGIDLTPMLDVVFILLIFFIVTASFVKEKGFEMQRPDESQQVQNEQQKNIIIQVHANNEIWMEERRIDIRSVRANIQRKKAENPDAALIIQSHPQAKHETLTKISDQSREAGVSNIQLIINDEAG